MRITLHLINGYVIIVAINFDINPNMNASHMDNLLDVSLILHLYCINAFFNVSYIVYCIAGLVHSNIAGKRPFHNDNIDCNCCCFAC